MSLIGFLMLLVVAALAGTLGQAIAGYSLGGCLTSILVGFVGAFLGELIASQLGLPELLMVRFQGESFPLLWAIIGSAVFTAILGLLIRRRRLV